MRTRVWATLAVLALWVQPAGAQDDDKDGDDAPKAGGSLDSGSDPANSEKSDDGPYRPRAEKREIKGGVKTDEAATDDDDDAPAPRDPMAVFAELLIGFGRVPMPEPAYEDSPSATAYALLLGGHYDLSPKLSVALRVPWTSVSVEGGDSASALGSPELVGEYRVAMSPRTEIPIQLGVGFPIASGDPDLTGNDADAQNQYFANMFADAASGWRDGELYMPQRLPIAPSIGIRHSSGKLQLAAFTKFLIMPKLGGDVSEPDREPSGTYTMPGVVLRSVTYGDVNYRVFPKPNINVGLSSWLAYKFNDAFQFESDEAESPSGLALAFEPHVSARFGSITPSIGYLLFIGEQLDKMNALRLRVDLAF